MSIETRKTKAGKTYYLARIRAGSELVASKSFARKSAAEAWEREQKHLLDTGRPLPPKRSFTLSELVAMFDEARRGGNPHTFDTDHDNLSALPKSLLARPVPSIRPDDIRNHLLAQLRDGKKPSTVARAKTTLSALFTFAADQGLLHQPHPVRTMKKIPELSQTQPSLSAAEIPTPQRVAAAIRELRGRRPDIADVFEFMSLTGVRWGEVRAIRVKWLTQEPLAQLHVERSHSDRYAEKGPKSWRGVRTIPLSPRALDIFRAHAAGKPSDAYLFTNLAGNQLKVGTVRKFPLGFRRHALRHYAASTWLRLGTPVNEVAEYLGDDARTVLKVYAHILGEEQRRDFVSRLAAAEHSQQPIGANRVSFAWPNAGTQDTRSSMNRSPDLRI
jgi:integrase